MNMDASIMHDLIAGADCDTGNTGQAQIARRIEFLYLALLGRTIDGHGLAYWVNQAALNVDAGETENQTMSDIATGFLDSSEFRAIANTENLLDTDGELLASAFLTYLYNEMGREQDEAGFNFWLGVIESDGFARMLAAFAASAAATEDGGEEDAEFLANRLQLELGVLRTAHEQNLTLSTEQLQALKATLLENRGAVLEGSLTIEALMEGL